MKSPLKRLHLEIQRHRAHPVGLIRSSFRQDGKVQHSNHGRITGLPLVQLRLIQAAFQDEVVPKDDPHSLQLLGSKEYGASYALLALTRQLGLEPLLYSRPQPWVRDCLAMIVGRLVYAGSKLALSHQWKNTALWELCGTRGPIDVEDHCYGPLDRLLARQPAIQRALAKQHLKNGHLVLYDITSSYLEGAYEPSLIVLFGYSRDGKRQHEQITLGLLCDERGCPVGVEVFAGNTQDAQTVVAKVKELRQQYGLKRVTLVGDRGMITQTNAEQLDQVKGLHTITALTHHQIVELLERKVIQTGLFDEHKIVEVTDPAQPERRYCLCRNPETAQRETRTRQRLLELTRQGLDKLAGRKRKAQEAKLGAQVGKILARYKMGKFVEWKVTQGRLVYTFKEAAITQEALLDGCYVIRATVAQDVLNTEETVQAYKSLTLVEQAFRTLKTVALEIRPIYHKMDHRIRAHVFLCVLAYYVEWHAQQRLQPLFAEDGQGKYRQWTMENVIQRLAAIRRERVQMAGVEFDRVTMPEADQRRILDLLEVKM
jgi:transposase